MDRSGIFVTRDLKMAADPSSQHPAPDLSYKLFDSPSWRDKEEPTTQDMLRETAEFICYYWGLPQATIAKVKKELHLRLACNYVLVSNVGENVGTRTSGDTEDVIRSFVEKGTPAPQARDSQETINTLRALQELEDIRENKFEKNSLVFLSLPHQICVRYMKSCLSMTRSVSLESIEVY